MSLHATGVELNSVGLGICGGSAALFSTFLAYPFDRVKTIFQVDDGSRVDMPRYRSIWSALGKTFKTEGLHGLYRGLNPTLLANTLSWTFYLFNYSAVNYILLSANLDKSYSIVLSSVVSSLLCSVVTNPIWVIKTRMQLQGLNRMVSLVDGGSAHKSTLASSRAMKRSHYMGIFDAFDCIWTRESIGGFYRGIVPSMLLSFHGAIQFSIYELVRSRYERDNTQPISSTGAFLLGTFSKAIAISCTYPLSVIRSRLQEQEAGRGVKYNSFLHSVKLMYREEGARGYYKGFGVNVIRLSLQSGIFFCSFEQFKIAAYNVDLLRAK